MIREDQAIETAEQQIQQDFPGFELGQMLRASYEDRCWYLFFRLHQGQDILDVLYGIYRKDNRSWGDFNCCPKMYGNVWICC